MEGADDRRARSQEHDPRDERRERFVDVDDVEPLAQHSPDGDRSYGAAMATRYNSFSMITTSTHSPSSCPCSWKMPTRVNPVRVYRAMPAVLYAIAESTIL